jgi:hypothetical protein
MTRLNVKAGDAVILSPNIGTPRIVVVNKVTPAAIYVHIGTGIQAFTPDGRLRGAGKSASVLLQAATPENRAEFYERIHRIRLLNTIETLTNMRRLTTDQLQRIVDIINEPTAGAS